MVCKVPGVGSMLHTHTRTYQECWEGSSQGKTRPMTCVLPLRLCIQQAHICEPAFPDPTPSHWGLARAWTQPTSFRCSPHPEAGEGWGYWRAREQ